MTDTRTECVKCGGGATYLRAEGIIINPPLWQCHECEWVQA